MLSIVIPVYNEEGAIADVLRDCHSRLSDDQEIIVVDDGSTDGTAAILQQLNLPNVRVVRHETNMGNGAAIMTGVHAADGEWIATIDADKTYYPSDIFRLFRILTENNADMIVGKREGLNNGPPSHRIARALLCTMAEWVSGQKIDDVNSGLRILRKDWLLRYEQFYPRRFSLHIVLTVCVGRDGGNTLYVPIDYGQRIGISKLSPGLRGPGNFLKFLGLVIVTALRHRRRKEET